MIVVARARVCSKPMHEIVFRLFRSIHWNAYIKMNKINCSDSRRVCESSWRRPNDSEKRKHCKLCDSTVSPQHNVDALPALQTATENNKKVYQICFHKQQLFVLPGGWETVLSLALYLSLSMFHKIIHILCLSVRKEDCTPIRIKTENCRPEPYICRTFLHRAYIYVAQLPGEGQEQCIMEYEISSVFGCRLLLVHRYIWLMPSCGPCMLFTLSNF